MAFRTFAKRDETLLALLSTVYTPTEIFQWLTCPNDQLDGKTPERLLADGKYNQVRKLAVDLAA